MNQENLTIGTLSMAIFKCLELYGWRHLTLVQVAHQAEIYLGDLHVYATSKEDLLGLIISYIERKTLDFLDPQEETTSSPNYNSDHVFDVLFSRFEAATPHKKAISILYKDLKHDAIKSIHLIPNFLKALERLGDLAGMAFQGPFAPLQRRGFGLLYLKAFLVWLEDDSQDQGKTMAETNKLATTYIPCLYDPCQIMNLN